MESTNGTDKQFAFLLSMGYSEMYIQRAINIHRKSKFGTNWDLQILIEIIDLLEAKDWKIEENINKHKYQNLKPSHVVQNQKTHHNSDMSSKNELLFLKALSLHQNKHYEECERVTKDVLRTNPNHSQALLLYKNLIAQRLSWYNNLEIVNVKFNHKSANAKKMKKAKNSMLSKIGLNYNYMKGKKRKNILKKPQVIDKHINEKKEPRKDKKLNQSKAGHWGFTKGVEFEEMDNNDQKENLNDDEFLAALSTAPHSIEDMFLSINSYEGLQDWITAPLPKTKSVDSNGVMMSANSYNIDSSDEKECETAYI